MCIDWKDYRGLLARRDATRTVLHGRTYLSNAVERDARIGRGIINCFGEVNAVSIGRVAGKRRRKRKSPR